MQPGWHPDPTGRHELRYFNGAAWTGDIADAGARGVDPVGWIGPTSPTAQTGQVGQIGGPRTGGTPDAPAPAAAWAGAPARRRASGLAIAGMVLGIVGVVTGLAVVVFYASAVCGVLALIFGLVSRRRAHLAGLRTDGVTTAALVLGPIALVLSVVGGIVFFTVIDDLIEDLERVAPADSFELDDPSCGVDGGRAAYTATLTNTSDGTDRFTVRVEFLEPGTRDVTARGSAVVDDVRAGESVQVAATALVDIEDVDCRVDSVLIGRPPFSG